ncbi:unnamed protein product [Mytilus coruscus]|uniref:MAM domain-containing protein n=1 Tax=Mytilus coruscus TaxID=42192 RepID=A0A6J8C3A2_MYTCO|nr:unnamed protein product [Mytilus coruscus]
MNSVWKMETVNLDVQQNGNMIAFIGIIRNYESCTIALDDVSITPGSCSGIETHTHRCTDLNNIMDIETCPKFYLEKYFQDLSLSFYPKKDGCLVYKEILDSFKNECSSFTDEHNCHLGLAKSIYQFPECFHLYDFQIQYMYTTGTILSKPEKKSADANNIGLVVGLVIGLLFLAVFVILIVIFHRRILKVVLAIRKCNRSLKYNKYRCSFRKRNKEIVNKIKRNDYIGQLQIALPQSSNSVSHVQYTYPESESSNTDHSNGNSGISFQNNNCQYDYTNITATNSRVNEGKKDNELTAFAHQKDMPRGKYVSNDDEYAIVDPKAKTSVYHSEEDKTKATENYMVLDPNETGFDRSNFSDKNQPYELAKPVSDKNTDDENDRYALSPEGTYDYSGSNRQNELEDNIYNHAVDDVYDFGSHKRTNEGKDDTYDHFFGQKTEDDYDISRKT